MLQTSLKKWITASLSLSVGLTAFSPLSAFAGTASEAGGNKPEAHLDTQAFSSESTSFVVEISEDAVLQAKQQGRSQSEAKLAREREKVLEELAASGTEFDVTQEYDQVFSGFALELPENELGNLLSIPGVKAVYPNEIYAPAETDFKDEQGYEPSIFNSAPYIGAFEAWETGFTGKGVTVGIIDTGVDYTHPDLTHAFGEYKGWDFVDNDADPQETLVGEVTSHGTHVAGTVAANGEIKGVAPDAQLLAYRVLGPGGRGTTSAVIAAIERAVEDGVDVMNLSLGAPLNNPDYATAIALDTAIAEGVVAVSANGNSGPSDWTVEAPGTSREAISVGATALPYNVFTAELATAGGMEIPSAAVMGFPSDEALMDLNGQEVEFVHAGLGSREEFAQVDASGKIALISRGTYPFVEKAENALQAGAIGAVIYNNVEDIQPEVPGMSVPTLMVSKEDGQQLLRALKSGDNLLAFTIDFSHRVDETVADFSSRGPVMDTWMIKPDVVAPGVSIVSTLPGGTYGANQGTSMAAPHVAGAAALILEAHPDWSPEFVKSALMNTAERLSDPDGVLYPHNTQGAGSIRPMKAIEADTLILPGSHSFGIFEKANGKEVRKQGFRIHNLSNKRKKFSVSFTGHKGIRVSTSNNLNVQPGKTQNLNFRVQVAADQLEAGYVEGTFQITDGTETYEVPTILFVQEPAFPLVNGLELGLSGDLLVGIASITTDIDQFSLRVRNEDTGELLDEVAITQNVPRGEHFFFWDMQIKGESLSPGRYALNPTGKLGDRVTEMPGGVLTITGQP